MKSPTQLMSPEFDAKLSALLFKSNHLYNDIVGNPLDVFVGTRDQYEVEEERLLALYAVTKKEVDKEVTYARNIRNAAYKTAVADFYTPEFNQAQRDLTFSKCHSFSFHEALVREYTDQVRHLKAFLEASK